MLGQLFARIAPRVRSFSPAVGGNVAITFAMATLPIIGGVGAAVDYSHANNVKAALQAALDSTALMLARDASDLNASDLNSKALNYFKAMFDRPEAKNIAVTATYTASCGSAGTTPASDPATHTAT